MSDNNAEDSDGNADVAVEVLADPDDSVELQEVRSPPKKKTKTSFNESAVLSSSNEDINSSNKYDNSHSFRHVQ